MNCSISRFDIANVKWVNDYSISPCRAQRSLPKGPLLHLMYLRYTVMKRYDYSRNLEKSDTCQILILTRHGKARVKFRVPRPRQWNGHCSSGSILRMRPMLYWCLK